MRGTWAIAWIVAGICIAATGHFSAKNRFATAGATYADLARIAWIAFQNGSDSAAARRALRAAGQEGVDALLRFDPKPPSPSPARDALPRIPTPLDAATSAMVARWEQAVDEVAGQRDGWASGLYWHTDLEMAKAEAAKRNRPILSLRLLGKLTDDLSCANSRFFRKLLYPNAEISKYLREHYVLHWETVRPVPIVTIDFGDGRTMKRTLTGNSAHYVLDARGRLVDCLPGLFGPQVFLELLKKAEPVALACNQLPSDEQASSAIGQFHSDELFALHREWEADMQKLGRPGTPIPSLPPYELAAKMKLDPVDEKLWADLATYYGEQSRLDQNSKALIGRAPLPAVPAGFLAVSKSKIETPFLAMVRELQSSVALDTVRNKYQLRSLVHQQLRRVLPLADYTAIVYRDLFLSPLDDPWYGLESGAFTGIDDPGIDPERAKRAPQPVVAQPVAAQRVPSQQVVAPSAPLPARASTRYSPPGTD